jgi:beta-lactamase regulating signal transducer with metallopeptidase domain
MTSTIAGTALFLSRWVALSVLGKATILLVLGLTAAWVAGRSRASVRHLVLGATFAALLALPLIVVTAPGIAIEVFVPADGASNAAVSTAPPPGAVPPSSGANSGRQAPGSAHSLIPSWPAILRFVWMGGTILLLAPLAVNLWSLRRLRRNGLPWPELRGRVQSLAAASGVRHTVEVLLHEEIPAPLTCGLWRPAILLPCDAREWSEAELRCALVHELEHVRRGDWAIQLMARTICGCYWLHPLVWVAWRRLCLEAERACDDAVIRKEERTDYAGQLVSLARRMSKAHAQPALGMANRSDLSRRVSAVLDSKQPRGRAGVAAAAVTVIGAALAVLAIAPVRAVAQAPATRSFGKDAAPFDRIRITPLNRALYEAAEEGVVDEIERLLNAGADVNCVLRGDGSPLIGAARKGRLTAVQILLDRGADPNMAVRGDGNPLIMAAREGHAAVVALLLDRGASINQVVPDDENALIQASGSGRLDVVKLLVGRGADVNARVWVEGGRDNNGEWRSPLSMARRHPAVTAYLLSIGARE